jgi:hypothetical protein
LKPLCSEGDFAAHFSAHFADRDLPMPAELDENNPFVPPAATNDQLPEVDDADPTREEVVEAMSQLKNGKARGTDDLANEQLKYSTSSPLLVDCILKLVIILWNVPLLPVSWLSSTITAIHKKGSMALPKNFRPISMLATLSKILTKIVTSRCRPRYEEMLSRDQFGFRSNSGTIDAIYCLRHLLDKTKVPVYALFLDLRGAFDLLDRKQLFRILEIQLGKRKAVSVLKAYYRETTANMKGGDIKFSLGSGVRQGAEESPMCFNIFFDYVLAVVEKSVKEKFPDCGVPFDFNIPTECNPRRRGSKSGPPHGKNTFWKILYADDLVFLDTDSQRLRTILPIVEEVFRRFGLIIAAEKTKTMTFNDKNESSNSILSLGETKLDHVKNFRYLGFNISSKSRNHFLNSQISSAWSAFNQNRRTLVDRRINLKARVSLLESFVRSKLLYSVQAWSLSPAEIRKLDVIYRGFLRKMIRNGFKRSGTSGEGKSEHSFLITNKKLYAITKSPTLESFVHKQFLKYTAHVTRMDNSSWQKQLLFMHPEGKTWSKCEELLGKDRSQIRREMQNSSKFLSDLEQRFGIR